MPQYPCVQIFLSAVRIDDPAVVVFGHSIDGQVPPPQIILQRDVG
jgi:hypothetical protein